LAGRVSGESTAQTAATRERAEWQRAGEAVRLLRWALEAAGLSRLATQVVIGRMAPTVWVMPLHPADAGEVAAVIGGAARSGLEQPPAVLLWDGPPSPKRNRTVRRAQVLAAAKRERRSRSRRSTVRWSGTHVQGRAAAPYAGMSVGRAVRLSNVDLRLTDPWDRLRAPTASHPDITMSPSLPKRVPGTSQLPPTRLEAPRAHQDRTPDEGDSCAPDADVADTQQSSWLD